MKEFFINKVVEVITKNPGKTSRELAILLGGEDKLKTVQENLSKLCSAKKLVKSGSIPYTYFVEGSKNKEKVTSKTVKNKKGNPLPIETREAIDAYIKNNPTAPYSVFIKEAGDLCSDANYYGRRRAITGVVAPHATVATSSIYMNIWSRPTEDFDEKTKGVFKDFLETLNKTRKSRFELIELKDPAVVEVRERTAR